MIQKNSAIKKIEILLRIKNWHNTSLATFRGGKIGMEILVNYYGKVRWKNEIRSIYLRLARISKEDTFLHLLQDGYKVFEVNAAQNLLVKDPERIHLKTCPLCHKLARTPVVEECENCQFDWHS